MVVQILAGIVLGPLTGAYSWAPGVVVAAVVLFVAYVCGGYVAGRMARFDGIKQGLAVWGWSTESDADAERVGRERLAELLAQAQAASRRFAKEEGQGSTGSRP